MHGRHSVWLAAVLAGALVLGCGGGSGGDDLGGADVPDPGVQDVVPDAPQDPGPADTADPGLPEDPGGGEIPESDLPVDEGPGDPGPGCVDPDGDGRGPNCEAGADCAPDDPLRYATAQLHPDGDDDGFGAGDAGAVCIGAIVPAGWAEAAGDCDDGDPAVYPGAPELADDGVANGCAGADLAAAMAAGVFVKPGASAEAAGTREDPLGTLAAGIAKAKADGLANVFVATGSLAETLLVNADVAIHGGYDATTWAKAAGATKVTSTGPVGLRVLDAALVLNRIEIYGFSNDGGTTPHLTVSGIVIEEGSAAIVDCVIGGGEIYASLTEGIQATTTGLWIVDADVRVVGSRVGSGSPRPVEYAGTGTVERIGVGTGILLQSGTLRMSGGVLGFGADVELNDILGTAIARAEVRGLKAAGGRAMLAGVDVSGSAEAGTDDTGADQGVARGVAEVDIAAIEVSGGAHVQVVNALVTVPRANATADVYVEGAGPADAVYEARVATAAVRVSDGILDLLHCVLYSDRFTEALGESYTPSGTATGTATTTVRLVEVGAGGQARVVNTSGISQVNRDDSALVQVGGGGRLRLVHDVLWDNEFGVCRVHDGTACAVDETGDLDDCAAASGCVAVQAQVADPKYKWWDGVNAGSPLLDGGADPATEGLGAFIDRAGNPRPNGDGWDIGAYEF